MTPIAAVQNRYNLLDHIGVEILADGEAYGVAFVPYWPLAFWPLAEHKNFKPRPAVLGPPTPRSRSPGCCADPR